MLDQYHREMEQLHKKLEEISYKYPFVDINVSVDLDYDELLKGLVVTEVTENLKSKEYKITVDYKNDIEFITF